MFGNYIIRVKVQLNLGLNVFGSELKAGAIGYTVGEVYPAEYSGNMINVFFPEYGEFSILCKSLEIIDEDYLKWLSKREKEFFSDIEGANDITIKTGPLGGFKKMTFNYDKGKMTFNYAERDKAKRIEEYFQKVKKEINYEVIR